MSKIITHEEFVSDVTKRHPHIRVMSEYHGQRKPIDLHCDIHDYDFTINAASILKAEHGCKFCAIEYISSKTKKSNEDFLEKVKDKLNPNTTILGEYTGSHNKIKCECKDCGNIWYAFPDALYNGNGCKKCAMKYVQNYRIKTHEQFLEEFRERNPHYKTIEILSDYTKDDEPILCRCKICGREWVAKPHNLINRRDASGCPSCNMSRGEQTIMNYLEDNNIEFEWQKTYPDLFGTGGGHLSYDFFIPNKNLLIEYQGEFHDGSAAYQTEEQLDYQKEHDKRKREYAKYNNIQLLEIWYKDYNNIGQILTENLAA